MGVGDLEALVRTILDTKLILSTEANVQMKFRTHSSPGSNSDPTEKLKCDVLAAK